MYPMKLRTKRVFHILKINRIMPFCNLSNDPRNLHPVSYRFPVVTFDKREPLVNALGLGDLCEYRRKSLLKTRFFGLL